MGCLRLNQRNSRFLYKFFIKFIVLKRSLDIRRFSVNTDVQLIDSKILQELGIRLEWCKWNGDSYFVRIDGR